MFVPYCKDLKLAKPATSFKKAVESLKYLTPVDFAAVRLTLTTYNKYSYTNN
jgi:hypothetical protein